MAEPVHTFAAGSLSCNCSVVADSASGEAAGLELGGEVDHVPEVLKAHGLERKASIHKHAPIDHVLDTARLAEEIGAPGWLHEGDLSLDRGIGLQAAMLGTTGAETPPGPDHNCTDGEDLELHQKERVTVLHTPGHTRGSVCSHPAAQSTIYAGDTLFRLEVILGYGTSTTMATELRNNPLLSS